MRKAAFHTLGCKLNFSETSTLKRSLSSHDFEVVDFDKAADVYIINTCSVTDNADKKCRHSIRQALRLNPDAFIAIVGCYAQLKPKEIANIPGVDVVLGAAEKFQLAEHINDLTKRQKGEIFSCDIDNVQEFHHAHSIGDRTRSFMKIQDGCDYSCAFCTIPLARGKSRNSSIEEVLDEARYLAEQGVKEVVLTGVNTGDFGKGIAGSKERNESFYELIQELDRVEGIERFRISSIEPNLLTDEIIDFVGSSDRFVPHFHIPLQSGSDTILRRMKRRYLRDVYVSRVERIKDKMPDACIGADVIVGFPGESDDLFLETYSFLNELNISYLHVFTYSERQNTLAVTMNDVVPLEVRKERSKMLRILSEKKKRHFYNQWKEGAKPVLVEAESEGEFLFGFTDNYVKVKMAYDEDLINRVVHVEPKKINSQGLMEIEIVEIEQTV